MIDFDNLDPETLYIIWDEKTADYTYVRTPDGVGCYFYDHGQRKEAEGDVCDVKRVKRFDSHKEWEDYRYREN